MADIQAPSAAIKQQGNAEHHACAAPGVGCADG
jgi:hypothetical protein